MDVLRLVMLGLTIQNPMFTVTAILPGLKWSVLLVGIIMHKDLELHEDEVDMDNGLEFLECKRELV